MNCKFNSPINSVSQGCVPDLHLRNRKKMRGMKLFIVPALIIVLSSSKPRKMRSLPDPIVPSQYQKSKFLNDVKNEDIVTESTGEVDEQDEQKPDQKTFNFTERTLIGVAGKRVLV